MGLGYVPEQKALFSHPWIDPQPGLWSDVGGSACNAPRSQVTPRLGPPQSSGFRWAVFIRARSPEEERAPCARLRFQLLTNFISPPCPESDHRRNTDQTSHGHFR